MSSPFNLTTQAPMRFVARKIHLHLGVVFLATASSALAGPHAIGTSAKKHSKAMRPAPPKVQPMVGFHAPLPGKAAPVDDEGRIKLSLVTLARGERLEMTPRDGGFRTADLERAAHVLRAASGDEHPIDPRPLYLIHRIQTHFGVPEIRVVSGYRVPKGQSRSNHGKGRAIDFVVPGVPDAEVARFARELGYVGVGLYPTSQFVHVDIRPKSYFWVDMSGPGKRNRERGVFPDLAEKSDALAHARGERPIEPFLLRGSVDEALRAHEREAQQSPEEEDEE